ncbi:MAG: rhodanese-like protein [Burkholderiaceae bacterium]|nr:rhodanese-like protein [Burkholderiaceae bacterium]
MCVISLTACKQASSQIQVNATQINAELAARQAVMLDVRTPDEYQSGHVRNALLVPHDSIAQTISSIAPDKNQTIYLYCRSGRRSGIAFDTLKGMGYTHIVNLGGLSDLAQYGLSIEK